MNQGRRLECLPGGFVRQLLGCQKAEFIVDQGQQFIQRPGLPALYGVQDARNVISGLIRHRDSSAPARSPIRGRPHSTS